MKPRVVVVGSLNMDLSVRVPRLPRPGETVAGQDVSRGAGGKGANQAVAAARLGADVTLVGLVGVDRFGDELLDAVAGEGVDVTAVGRSEAPTGIAMIVVDRDGENTITTALGANNRLTGAGLEHLLPGATALLLQLETPVSGSCLAAEAAHRHGVRVVLNAAPLPGSVDDSLRALLAVTDLLIVNEIEAAGLGGDASALRALGPAEVVVTLGERGALLADHEGVRAVPAFTVTPVDTVGAGDAFCAELALARPSVPLDEAVRRACAAGALATTRAGAQPALPTRAEVDAVIAREGTDAR